MKMDPNDVTEINLRLGWPNPRVLPVKMLQEASQVALSRPEAYTRDSLLEYGPDDGFKPLRDKIATWLTTFYLPSQPITTERICISGGASQNLACVLDTFTDPAVTQSIWMIAPTYFCACRVFDDAGFAGKLRAVPEDPEGLDIRFLSKQLEIAENTRPVSPVATKTRRPWNKTYHHVIYLVPTFANPSGRIVSAKRREELIRVARKYDALIVSDDVYDMLAWDYAASESENICKAASQPRLVDVDRYLDGGPSDDFGNTMSNGSFSKIIGPGLRTGWAEATPKFVFGLSQSGSTRSGGCGSQFSAAILAEIIDTKLPEYMHTVLQPTYARRYRKIMGAIKKHLAPLGITTPPPDKSGVAGGYYVWLQLPGNIKASDVSRAAEQEYHLLVHPGSLFQVEGDTSDAQHMVLNGIRLCFVWAEEELLADGIERLAATILGLLKQ